MATKTASTQQYLNVADIRDDILVLRNGEVRMVLELKALNFALKSEQEQAAIVYQYQAFLNSLQFPVQIIVQSRRLDLTRYMTSLESQLAQTGSPLLKAQIADYLDFISRLINLGNIMEKRFYVVIPYSSGNIRSRNLIGQLLKHQTVSLTDEELAEAKTKMADRLELIRSGLASIGLSVESLSGEETAKLLYLSYNPPEVGEIEIQPPLAEAPKQPPKNA